MVGIIIFGFDLINAVGALSRKNSWRWNIEVFVRHFKHTFLCEILIWISIVFIMVLYQIEILLGNKLQETVKLFGTLGNALSFYATLFILMIYVYLGMMWIQEDKRLSDLMRRRKK